LTKARSALEWVAIVVVSVVVAGVAIALLSGYFAGNDTPGVTGSSSAPGVAIKDLGDAHLKPGQALPRYSSNPPTSGPHVPVAVHRDGVTMSNNQLLEALELGDVVVVYGSPRPPADLQRVANAAASPFTPALAAAGQAVILTRRPGTPGVLGLAWARMIRVATPSAPALHQFINYWLGRGAGGT
jgi:Protein of unknown function (DUF3105)